jgi:hypothetical protein
LGEEDRDGHREEGMSGSAHYLEPKFLSELAYEVAALESVSKDLTEADLTNEKLVRRS